MKFEGFVSNDKGVSAVGGLAQRLLATNMDTKSLRPVVGMHANATLRKDEWKTYDEAVLKAATQRRIGVADLLTYGLTYNLGNGLGTMVLEYETVNEFTAAEVTMDARARIQKDRPNFEIAYLPIPITHKDYSINARALAASRSRGDDLNTTSAELASQKVAEMTEQYLFKGSGSFTYGGGTIYGYMTAPNRNQVTFSSDEWDNSAGGDDILADVMAMKQALIDARYYGPYMLYIPTNFETAIDDDYKAASDKSIRQRIKEVDRIIDVKVADFLTDDNVIMVQMTPDVVRLVNGMELSNVEWNEEGGMTLNYKVMEIKVPQIRSDQNSRCGIAHLSA